MIGVVVTLGEPVIMPVSGPVVVVGNRLISAGAVVLVGMVVAVVVDARRTR